MVKALLALCLSLLVGGADSFRRRPVMALEAEAPSSGRVQKKFATTAQEVVKPQSIMSVRVRHVLCATEDLAQAVLNEARGAADGQEAVAALARSVSACASTREEGGEVGWASPEDEHLDEILPENVRRIAMGKKPGDIFLEPSTLGVHVVCIEDVFTRLEPTLRRRAPMLHNDLEGHASARTPFGELLGSGDEVLTYSIETMGCQMNNADSERMAGQLAEMGLQPHDTMAGADGVVDRDAAAAKRKNKTKTKEKPPSVVVINTCSIRDHAEQKVYSYLGPHAVRKRRGEPVTIVVAGCVAQQEGEKLVRRVPEIDAVIGPQYANRLGEVLLQVADGDQVVATDATLIQEDAARPRRQSSVCGWVNVIYGCNERCSYCVVPTTRGVEQSRPMASVLAEVRGLVASGYREVTLLGQNIDAYGSDMAPKKRFHELLEAVAGVEGVGRVRFLTAHPRYMSERVVDAVARHPKVLAPCFHIPFQSGSNRVLKDMARGHTREKYLKIVERIKRLIPHAAITADAIVGFPGETEQDFLDTLDLMEQVKFDQLNTAAYSPRPNTPAATREDQVEEDVKEDRLRRINELAGKHALERSEAYVGRVEEVLVEASNAKRQGQVRARTGTNRLVFFEGDIDELMGKFVRVKITGAMAYSLTGERVGDDMW